MRVFSGTPGCVRGTAGLIFSDLNDVSLPVQKCRGEVLGLSGPRPFNRMWVGVIDSRITLRCVLKLCAIQRLPSPKLAVYCENGCVLPHPLAAPAVSGPSAHSGFSACPLTMHRVRCLLGTDCGPTVFLEQATWPS